MVVYISTNFVDYRASVVDFRKEREGGSCQMEGVHDASKCIYVLK